MISQYVSHHADVQHFVVEHDKEWIDFSKPQITLSSKSKIINLELEKTSFNGVGNITAYKNFSEQFSQYKFDMLCIDGPFGSQGYSRIDTLCLLEKNLANSFVILMDDHERQGEQNTVKQIQTLLEKQEMKPFFGTYRGAKHTAILASADLKFLCSL